jgi:putative hemolysin
MLIEGCCFLCFTKLVSVIHFLLISAAIGYSEHGRLITRSWCSFISSPLSQEMSARYLVSMMHNQEMVGPCDVFSMVAPLAVRCPRPEQGPASNLTISGLFIGIPALL